MIRHKTSVFLAGWISLSVFISVCCASGGELEPSLAALARAAKSHFVPLTADDLKQAKADLTAAAERLDARLKEDPKNGEGWRKFTRLDDLLKEVRGPELPKIGVLETIRAKFLSGQEGLELIWFVDVRQALRKYIERAGAIDDPQRAKALYEKVLDQLAADLEAAGTHPSADQAFRIGETLRWLPLVRQAPELVAAVDKRLVHPNVYLQASAALVGAGIAGPVDETAPVRDCILDTDISGMGRTVGQTTACLFPDAEEGVLDVILQAVNNSQTVGRNGPVCIHTTGRTEIGVCKRLWMDADGWWSHPAAANACTHTTINDICPTRGGALVERIAWKRADQQQGEAEAIASEHARWRAAQRVDQQADEMLQKANQDYQNKFRAPWSQRSIFPQDLRFSTTTDAFSVVVLEAGVDQLAAPAAPPEFTEKSSDMALRIHQSAVNNAAATMFSGMVLHEETLQRVVIDLLGYLPERMKPDEDHEPWTIEFARQQPISVTFDDGGFAVTLRGQHFFKSDQRYPGMNITAVYKFVNAEGVFKAVRQGELQIFPPGFDPNQRHLSVREQTIHRLLQRRLGKMLQAEMVAKGFTPKGKWAAAGRLVPVEMDAQGGWLVIAWRRSAEKTEKPETTGKTASTR
jgi:hypothetical protein